MFDFMSWLSLRVAIPYGLYVYNHGHRASLFEEMGQAFGPKKRVEQVTITTFVPNSHELSLFATPIPAPILVIARLGPSEIMATRSLTETGRTDSASSFASAPPLSV